MFGSINDFFADGVWHFDHHFVVRFPDIDVDILNYHFSQDGDFWVWPSLGDGVFTSRKACDLLHFYFSSIY